MFGCSDTSMGVNNQNINNMKSCINIPNNSAVSNIIRPPDSNLIIKNQIEPPNFNFPTIRPPNMPPPNNFNFISNQSSGNDKIEFQKNNK